MDILLHHDCFQEYIKSLLEPARSVDYVILTSIINNPHHRFLFNKQLEKLISEAIEKDHPLRNFYELFIVNFINGKIIPIEINDEELYQNLDSKYKEISTKAKSGTYLKFSFDRVINDHVSFVEIKKSKKPNKEWLYTSLAVSCNNSVTVRYNDFENVNQIVALLESAYEITNDYEFVNIFDRNQNLDHRIFDWFLGRSRIEYLTMRMPKHQINSFLAELRGKFIRAHVYVAAAVNIHERRILLKGLIVEFDDDFQNITPDRPTWKIDITCCDMTAKSFLEKKANLFNKFNIN